MEIFLFNNAYNNAGCRTTRTMDNSDNEKKGVLENS